MTAIFFAYGCGGGCGGCSSMEPIPGGFPPAERMANAGQVRVTQSGIAKVTADPAAVIGPLVGGAMNGIIDFNIPASCGGSPSICCPNGQPSASCGPLEINLNKLTGDQPRLAVTPVAGASRVDATLRARIKTKTPLPITYSGIDCTLSIDTTKSSSADLRVDLQLQFSQDASAGTTRIDANTVNVSQLDSGDLTLGGGLLCSFGGAIISLFIGTLTDQISTQIKNTINSSLCKSCDSGSVAECGSSFATACTNGTCMIGTRCMQEVGLDGRLRGSSLFASLSPGTTGALDLYEVTGGYATTDQNGVALGMLGGMVGGGSARDRCGPQVAAPPNVSIPLSSYFQGNTRPDTGAAFDVGIGLHKSQLADLAWGGYDGGLFCLTIGANTFSQLSTDTISLLSRSLGKLVEGNSAMAVGLRPQSPPTITLGRNTFKDDGTGKMVVDQPLLDLLFKALEIDFFASVDDQYIRVFTVVADVHMPIGLQTTTMGKLTPVIGNPADAFSNISVKNNEAITESPADLAGLFPTLLQVALPQLSGAISPISLPALGGLALSVTDVTAVDNDSFLAIYANLVPATMARVVTTTAQIVDVRQPSEAIARDIRKWRTEAPPEVTLALGGDAPDLEFSYRTDDGFWSAWSRSPRETISPSTFWLAGNHKIEVRARQIGHPETMDPVGVRLDVPLGTVKTLARTGFHGQAGASGCNCETGQGKSGALVALAIALLLLPMRKLRRRARRHLLVWLIALACLPGCSCGNPCGDSDCVEGDLQGGIGRWTSIAGDSDRVLVATYEQVFGDLVVVDATKQSDLKLKFVDGVPDTTPTHDPDGYRSGIEDPGTNVGAWTSIAMSGGLAAVAYQDRDEGTLKYAYETSRGSWSNYVVDSGNAEIGAFASMVFDADKKPAIAYIAIGVDDGSGLRNTELRLARGTSSSPSSMGEWKQTAIASAPGTCAGLCGGEVCVTGLNAGDPQTCVAPTTTCSPMCPSSQACSAGVCRDKVEDPKVTALPGGTGLYVSLVVMPDGRLAAAYYDMNRRALVLAMESSKGSSQFAETLLDGNAAGADRGMWASAVVGNDGTVHIAYQDALGDQLMYTTYNGAPGTPEIVDDGQRTGDRTHPVGAAASIYLAGGTPTIAYQDGMTADVMIASKGTPWSVGGLAMGPLLDGFSIAVTTAYGGKPVLAWDSLNPANAPPNGLVVRSP